MALSKTTQNHEEIQGWAEARGGKPAEVASTGKAGAPGILRIEFPSATNANDANLNEISWESFFEKFDASGLSLVYQEVTSEGAESNFSRLVYPENLSDSARKSLGKKASAKGSAKKVTSAKTGSKKAAPVKAAAKTTAKKAAPAKKTTAAKPAKSATKATPAKTSPAATKKASQTPAKATATKASARKAAAPEKTAAKKTAAKGMQQTATATKKTTAAKKAGAAKKSSR